MMSHIFFSFFDSWLYKLFFSTHHETALKFFFFTKLKSLGLVLSLLSDHIQRNSVDKDFQILIKLNYHHIHRS